MRVGLVFESTGFSVDFKLFIRAYIVFANSSLRTNKSPAQSLIAFHISLLNADYRR